MGFAVVGWPKVKRPTRGVFSFGSQKVLREIVGSQHSIPFSSALSIFFLVGRVPLIK